MKNNKHLHLIKQEDDKVDSYKDKLNDIRFEHKELTVIEEDDIVRHFMFIVLRNKKTKKMRTTGYSLYFFKSLESNSLETLEYHATIITLFLNYIFIDKYEEFQMKDISQFKIEYGNQFLRDYSQGKIGNELKTKQAVNKAKNIINKFIRFIYMKEKTKMLFINDRDFLGVNTTKRSVKGKERKGDSSPSIFSVVPKNTEPPKRVKSLSSRVFQEMLYVCDIHYPMMKLGLCLQAFGGLRRGEVCNVSLFNTSFHYNGKDLGWFIINLKEKRKMREDGKDVGGIKKKREQPIHPTFLSMFQQVYDQHMELIKGINDPYGAIFLNDDNVAMTKDTYAEYFQKIMLLTIERLSKYPDFRSNSEMRMLMNGMVNTHVLRHFFSQFIAKIKLTRNPAEVAYWRGDSSLDTAITYLRESPLVDEKIRQVQQTFYGELKV